MVSKQSKPINRLAVWCKKVQTTGKWIVELLVQLDANYQEGQIYAKGLVGHAVLGVTVCPRALRATTRPVLAMLNSPLVAIGLNALEYTTPNQIMYFKAVSCAIFPHVFIYVLK